MENYIDLINDYLDKTLSKEEVLAFENRLKTDAEFKTIYGEHLTVLKGIERTELKAEINKAKQNYTKAKWIKQAFVIAIPLLITLVSWILFFNNEVIAKSELRKLLNFETELTQNFEVSTDSLIQITGKKGTQIIINPNDLEYLSGEEFKKVNLSIELIELTSKQELLLANTQTLSNGEWLISGGAFKIEIKSGSKPLRLKNGKTINAKFPKNTKEEEMQIFYGERDKKGYLNWNLSNIELKNEQQFVIYFKDTLVLDEERTRAFGGVETMKTVPIIDTLGYLSSSEIITKFPEIETVQNQKDTLVIHKEYILNNETGQIWKYSIGDKNFINERYNDSILTVYHSNKISENQEREQAFYQSVNLSKLGWVNIDQYANYDDLITLRLDNNLGFDFNTSTEAFYTKNSIWHETYLIDNKNNTVLNVYSNVLEIPKGESFTIVSYCIVDDTFYVCRKAINTPEKTNISLYYKKRNKEQIKSLLRF